MRAKWYMFGCLTSVGLIVIFVIMLISALSQLSSMAQRPATKIDANTVLHLKLSGAIQEYNPITDMTFNFMGDTGDSVHDLILKIRSAKDDNRIKSILLEPQFMSMGYANINEMLSALNDFKSSGKKIYGYINMATQQDILLMSVADEIYMNPSASAGFYLHGIGGTMDFYKDMLEKLGIKINVVRAGDYKSAAEPFTRTSMSPELRRNITQVYSDIYDVLVNQFAANFESTPAEFRSIFEKRESYLISLEEGKQIKVVNELMFFDEFLKKTNIPNNKLVNISKYTPTPQKQHANKIAVVYMLGNIVSTTPGFGSSSAITSTQFNKIFDDLIKDNNVRAVVIRITSPGGSALESEIIHHKLAQLKEKKPVIVSMGGVAASGGYYIPSNANYIFADPYTITGSIGVIGMIPDLSGTAKKIGITSEPVGHGKYLTAGSMLPIERSFETALQKSIMNTYHEFKTRVSEGRDIPYTDVEKIAQGQVWSSKKALEYKLIDEIGMIDDAINKAAEITHVANYSLVYYPTKRSFIEVIMEEYMNISLPKMLLTRKLPNKIVEKTDEMIELFDQIKHDPIQMRNPFELKIEN